MSYSIDTALGTASFPDYESANRYWNTLDPATLIRLGPIDDDEELIPSGGPILARLTYTGPDVHSPDDPHQIRSKWHGETLGVMLMPRNEYGDIDIPF